MSNYNNENNNKIEMRSKDKNSFLNTNYRQKNQPFKFNSIGKLISMNNPSMPKDKVKKPFSKNKIKNDNFIIHNNGKSPTVILNSNIIQGYNSKSENDLCSNISENDLYGTIHNFSKKSTPKKKSNNINKVNVVFQGEDNKNNNYPDNKINDSFSSHNNENKLMNSSKFQKKILIGDENKKKEINEYNSDDLNNNSSFNYFISHYGAYTLGGTDAFGHPKTNQDSYITKVEDLINSKEYTFGVFDGHGLQGHLVSDEIKNYLMNVKFDQYYSKQSIISMFNSLSKSIENSKNFDPFCSGSTAVITHITKDKIICANCGDSRAILIGDNGIVKISRDHKPELRDEKKRIIASGGRVDKIYGMGPYRVWFKDGDYPGLAMSRSIGDTLAHKIGVSSIPEIKEFIINNVKPIAIVVASDGVWEFMSNEQVKNILMKYKYDQDAIRCSKEIVERARQIWKGTSYAIDDITCITAFFDKN